MTYRDVRISLLTQHAKEQVLAPVLAERLGASVEVVHGFDTDSLGTFTRDIPRLESQQETALRKAKLAIELSGASCGLGSEGSFVPGPFGLGSWNVEVVAFVDAARGIEVFGRAHGAGRHVHGLARTMAEAHEMAVRVGFPEYGLVIRPNGPDDPRVRKGIRDALALDDAFHAALRESCDGAVFMESDLRAHQHPSRMAMIGRAGEDLAERLATMCPMCGLPGFGWTDVVPGLRCAACGLPTDDAVADVHACVRCACRQERPRGGEADPSHCSFCNP
jgi:hypothetical protein